MAVTEAPPQRKPGDPIDWEAIEPHWRAGIVSVKQLAREFGCSRPALDKHFGKRGIARDLSAQIKGEAATLVQRAEATGTRTVASPAPAAPDGKLSMRDVVGANARQQAGVILSHRSEVGRALVLTSRLLTELESQTFDSSLYQQLDQLMRKAGADGKVAQASLKDLQALYARTCTSTQRTDNMRKLAEILKTLVELERKVHGIADTAPVDPAEGVAAAAKSGFEELKSRFDRHLKLVPPAPGRAA